MTSRYKDMFYYVHEKWPSVLNVLAKRSGTVFKVHYRLLEMDLDIVLAKLDMKKCIIVLKCSSTPCMRIGIYRTGFLNKIDQKIGLLLFKLCTLHMASPI